MRTYLSCGSNGNFQLKRHLSANEACFTFFKQRFNVSNWDELKKKLITFYRVSYASRSNYKRRLENAAQADRRKDIRTIIQSLNSFRQNTAIVNYRLCIVCEQFFTNTGAVEVKNSDSLFEEYDLEHKNQLKRLNKHWICLMCQSSGKKPVFSFSRPIFKVVELDGYKILAPNHGNPEENIGVESNNLVLIPHNITADQQLRTFVVPLYKNLEITNDLLSTLYQNRASKFAARKLHNNLYDGEKLNGQNRKLQSISQVYDDSPIRSSISWCRKRKNSMFSQFLQHGQAAVGFSIDLNINNRETTISSLLCEGSVITLQFIGNCNGENQTQYLLHNHHSSTPCDDSCVKEVIRDFSDSLDLKYLPIFINSLFQKQSSLIEHLIKNKNFDLYSENYFVGIDFYISGAARINGVLWTMYCDKFNMDLSSSTLNGNNVTGDNFLHHIETSILTTVNSRDIRDNTGLSEQEAIDLRNLAEPHQVNLNIGEKHLPLPSFLTMFRIEPGDEASLNIVSSKTLILLFKTHLINLSEEEKYSLTTEDWFEMLSRKSKFVMKNEFNMKITFEQQEIHFFLEERLNAEMTRFGCFIGL